MTNPTLNAISLLVFALTLASLVGPLVNVSPVPVATVVGIGLAGFALDQLSFQGRLRTLLADCLAWLSPAHRERVLHHEAGHFLVAVLLDIPVQSYSLNTWETWKQGLPGQGGVVFGWPEAELPAKLDGSPQWIDRYCQVWMAGIAAEQMIYGDAQGGESDVYTLRRCWCGLGGSLAEAMTKERWAILQVTNLLHHHRPTYDALVQAMADRQNVEACYTTIQTPPAS
ncbi:MAG: ATP-dependent Zn protease [Cyanobacteria bacterium REEB459]|nr:ATP-dependent Zn protease [Cyanobacteria bacterium REEB459]